jgi:transcriptional regulator with XRE-family HTH domain
MKLTNQSNNIRFIRDLFSYSREYVGNKLNISARAYGKYEEGEAELSDQQLEILSTLYDSPIKEIIFLSVPDILNRLWQNPEKLDLTNTLVVNINTLSTLLRQHINYGSDGPKYG